MKPQNQISADAVMVYKTLKNMKVGEQVHYTALESVVPGRKLRGKDAFVLQTARAVALREEGMVFETIRGIGLKRVSSTEIVQYFPHTTARIHRLCRREAKKQAVVKAEELTNDQKLVHLSNLSMIGALALVAQNKSAGRIESKVRELGFKFSPEDTLRLFT